MSEISSIVSQNQLSTGSVAGSSLGKDDFLKLLMVQLQNQDPLSPMENEAMIAQMAQFSSLEQLSNVNDNLENMGNRDSFISATQLLGKEVETIDPSSLTGDTTITNRVQSISLGSEGPILKLDDGSTVRITDVVRVNEAQG